MKLSDLKGAQFTVVDVDEYRMILESVVNELFVVNAVPIEACVDHAMLEIYEMKAKPLTDG